VISALGIVAGRITGDSPELIHLNEKRATRKSICTAARETVGN